MAAEEALNAAALRSTQPQSPIEQEEGVGNSDNDTPVSHAARTVTAAGAELKRLEEELERRLDRIVALEEEVCMWVYGLVCWFWCSG